MLNDVGFLLFGYGFLLGGLLLYNYGDNVVFVVFWDVYFIRDCSNFNLFNMLLQLLFFSDFFVYLIDELDLFMSNNFDELF